MLSSRSQLCTRRSMVRSGHPKLKVLFGKLCGKEWELPLPRYGEVWPWDGVPGSARQTAGGSLPAFFTKQGFEEHRAV